MRNKANLPLATTKGTDGRDRNHGRPWRQARQTKPIASERNGRQAVCWKRVMMNWASRRPRRNKANFGRDRDGWRRWDQSRQTKPIPTRATAGEGRPCRRCRRRDPIVQNEPNLLRIHIVRNKANWRASPCHPGCMLPPWGQVCETKPIFARQADRSAIMAPLCARLPHLSGRVSHKIICPGVELAPDLSRPLCRYWDGGRGLVH